MSPQIPSLSLLPQGRGVIQTPPLLVSGGTSVPAMAVLVATPGQYFFWHLKDIDR